MRKVATTVDICRKKYWNDSLRPSDESVLELCDAHDAALAQVAALTKSVEELTARVAELTNENQHTCTDYNDPCAQCDRDEIAERRRGA